MVETMREVGGAGLAAYHAAFLFIGALAVVGVVISLSGFVGERRRAG